MKVNPQQLQDDGFIILRQVIPPEKLDKLRASFEVLVDRQRAIWARERKPDDAPGGVWETHQQPRLRFQKLVDEATADTIEFCLHENTLDVSRQLIRAPEVGLHAMFLMCNPARDHGPASWHRDTHSRDDVPLERIERDMLVNGPGYVQWNIPLYDDRVLWVVPGSHRRLNTAEEDRQLEENPHVPLPGSVPVDLKAGDGVVYTNFILHWGSSYSPELRRTIHMGYQCFGAPLYRYFHLWWDLGFTKNIPDYLRTPFEHWAHCIAREHDIIESICRAMLNKDAPAFRAALTSLHPSEQGHMMRVVLLCKVAGKVRQLSHPDVANLPPAERARAIRMDGDNLHLYEDVARRFSPLELETLWQRFAPLDARLQMDTKQPATGSPSEATQYSDKMPAGFDVDEFIASWRS